MGHSKVTSKGQITIPKPIRDRFGLDEGDTVEFIVDDEGRLFLRPRISCDRTFGLLSEFARERPVSVEEMKEAVRSRAARKAR